MRAGILTFHRSDKISLSARHLYEPEYKRANKRIRKANERKCKPGEKEKAVEGSDTLPLPSFSPSGV